MHFTISTIAAFTALSAAAALPELDARQTNGNFTTCDGDATPVWSDCDSQIAPQFCNNLTGVQSAPLPPNNELIFGAGNKVNCQVAVFWSDRNVKVTNEVICEYYGQVQNTCQGQNSGGMRGDGNNLFTVSVTKNSEFRPNGKRELAAPQPEPVRRQQSGDNKYVAFEHDLGQKLPMGKTIIGAAVPGKTTIMIMESMTVSTKFETSVSIGANFLDIINTSLSTSFSQDQSTTSSFGEMITIDCPTNQVGQLYFQAEYEVYKGNFEPSGDRVDIMAPQLDGQGKTKGQYSFDCRPQ